jgi:hypothetical protein
VDEFNAAFRAAARRDGFTLGSGSSYDAALASAADEEARRRLEVGRAAGLPLVLAEALVGDTEEAMTADAERLRLLVDRAPLVGSFEGGARQPPPAPPADFNRRLRRAIGQSRYGNPDAVDLAPDAA